MSGRFSWCWQQLTSAKAPRSARAVPATSVASTSNARANVPDFTASNKYTFGSHATEDPKKQAFRWVWSFDDTNLPAELVARNDHGDHISIEPKAAMERSEFRRLDQDFFADAEIIDGVVYGGVPVARE